MKKGSSVDSALEPDEPLSDGAMWKKALLTIGIIVFSAVILFGLIQLVPYGQNHTNPPVLLEPNWSSAEIRALARRACFDCHSNETVWPWYADIAPLSWLVQRDVEKGREELNFSTWGAGEKDSDDLAEKVIEGDMPPFQYLILHPEARLSAAEKDALISGLSAISR